MKSDLNISVEDRILLYLAEYKGLEERFEMPQGVTQESIAFAVGVERKHVSRYLKTLKSEGYLTEKKSRVEGMRRKLFVYYEDLRGEERAAEIRKNLLPIRVPVVERGVEKELSLQEIDNRTSVHLTLPDIVRAFTVEGVVRMEELEAIDDKRKRELDARVAKLDAYARALLAAWSDGKVTATERLLIEELRKHLGIPEAEHGRLEQEVIRKITDRREGEFRIYRTVFLEAKKEGISEEERKLLEVLRRELSIPRKTAEEIELLT